MTRTWFIRRLHAVDDAQIDQLASVLIDCVEGGASVSFMHPLTRDRAVSFWQGVARGVATGERALLVAEDAEGVCGTVQLVFDMPENQPHRADLAKMLVHRRARRQGLGEALVRAADATARECGKTLLVLDAVTGGDAARMYERLGWVRVGDIPGYALFPRGGLCTTTVFHRDLAELVVKRSQEPSARHELGLPDRARLHSLTVSESGRCLVVAADKVEGGGVRLFVRGFGDAAYQEVPWPDGCNAFQDPVASPTAPMLYALGMNWQDNGGNYVGLYRLGLPAVATELVMAAHLVVELRDGSERAGRSWISQLLGFAADGRRLLIVRAGGETSGTSTRFDYSVCTLDPDDGTMEPLVTLPAVFA